MLGCSMLMTDLFLMLDSASTMGAAVFELIRLESIHTSRRAGHRRSPIESGSFFPELVADFGRTTANLKFCLCSRHCAVPQAFRCSPLHEEAGEPKKRRGANANQSIWQSVRPYHNWKKEKQLSTVSHTNGIAQPLFRSHRATN